MKKQTVAYIVLALIVIAAVAGAWKYGSGEQNTIGGERDMHGCLTAAGYGWNESESECVREWEMGEERYQVKDFISCREAGYPVMESFPLQCKTPSGKNFVEISEEERYFSEQMWRKGVENLGGAMPIEGFNPDLYMSAFKGLEWGDFDGAEAIGGRWEFKNGELKFVKTEEVITSADGTLTESGLIKLLANLEDRFGFEVGSLGDVERIFDLISGEENEIA